jgi:hypothetical protein
MTIQGDGLLWDALDQGSAYWPYPQVRQTDFYTIALHRFNTDLRVYELVCLNGVWTATEVYNLGAFADIDFVDITGWGQFYTVTASKIINNQLTITAFMRNPDGSTTDLPNTAVPEFSCICNFNGQAIIGGLVSPDAPWDSLLWSSVAWSAIGNFDFRPTEKGVETAGFGHIPSIGQGTGRILRVGKLGEVVNAYTEEAVHFLIPHAIGRTGYGYGTYDVPGIPTPNHMAGNENAQLFIDTDNELWLALSGKPPELLGYKEFMDTLTESEVRMSYVPQKNSFYISDSDRGFILNRYGLYECHQKFTSVVNYRGLTAGFFISGTDVEARMTFDTLDFGVRGLKTVHSIQTDASFDSTAGELYGSCKYKYGYNSSHSDFTQFDWIRMNEQGISSLFITADEFRMMVKGEDYRNSGLRMSRVDLKLKYVDKRGIRGLSNAIAATARTGF